MRTRDVRRLLRTAAAQSEAALAEVDKDAFVRRVLAQLDLELPQQNSERGAQGPPEGAQSD